MHFLFLNLFTIKLGIHQHVYHDIIEVCNLLFKSGKKCIYCCDLELTYKMFFSKNDKYVICKEYLSTYENRVKVWQKS